MDLSSWGHIVSIYPNPASHTLHVKGYDLPIVQIKIINLLGEVQMAGPVGDGDITIDVSGLCNGLYQVLILTKDNQVVFRTKLLVVH